MNSFIRFSAALFGAAFACSAFAAGEIPAAAKADPRYALGYLVVTAYPGVKNDGSADATVGLQRAIDDGRTHGLTVLFPAGEYLISDTLRCFNWQVWSAERALTAENPKAATSRADLGHHILFGAVSDGRRPRLRLAPNARGFDDPGKPKPMMAFRLLRATGPKGTKPVPLAHPLDDPEDFSNAAAVVFGEKLCRIDFDCGRHPGAMGLFAPMAQDSTILDVRIDATGAYAGIHGLPGRNSVTGNVEIVGGRIGIINSGSIAGAVIVGARLLDQTEASILHTDFSPLVMTGFEIRRAQGPALRIQPNRNTANSALSLIDGILEVGSGEVALDNTVGKTIYLRNVYVRGAAAAIRSGTQPPVPAAAGWTRIDEYAYADQTRPDDDPPYEVRDSTFRVFNVIDGRQSTAPEPATRVGRGEPPADLRQRHLWRELPIHAGARDGTLVATARQFGANAGDDGDDAEAIQRAIDAASAAGHGRVFLPAGEYLIGRTITLRANTVLMGAGWHRTEISAHPGWRPKPGEMPPMIDTVDDAAARTVLAMMTVSAPAESFTFDSKAFARGLTVEELPPRNRIGMIRWRAGRHSMTIGLVRNRRGAPTHQRLFASAAQEFSGHGGGRHYSIHLRPPSAYPRYRPVLIDGTTEPLAIYGLNSESPYTPARHERVGMTDDAWLDRYALEANTEIRRAANVRIYGVKREGASPTIIVRDSRNVAMYSSGAMRNPVHPRLGGYIQLRGDNRDVMIAVSLVQAVKTMNPGRQEPLVLIDDGKAEPLRIDWPDSVALIKRGEIDDTPFR